MIKELDTVVLTDDLPDYDLGSGDLGTVVLVHKGGEGFSVEFVTIEGETIAVVSLLASQVRSVSRREIASARAERAVP